MASPSPEDLPDTIAVRRFEVSTEKSYKFWTIELEHRTLRLRHGRIGSPGTSQELSYDTVADAKKQYATRVRRKSRDGYVEKISKPKKKITNEELWESLAAHEPFLQQILASPDDIGSYAIYADWLLEHEDPRGTFMMRQIELESEQLPQHKILPTKREIKSLQVRNARQWMGPLSAFLMDRGLLLDSADMDGPPYEFHRGMLSTIRAHNFGVDYAHTLKNSPHCRMLTYFHINNFEDPATDITIDSQEYHAGEHYGLLPLEGADLRNLQHFGCGNRQLFETGHVDQPKFDSAQVFDIVQGLPRLESLSIDTPMDTGMLFKLDLPKLKTLVCDLDSRGIHQLIESPLLAQLDWLTIGGPVSEASIESLLASDGFHSLIGFCVRTGKLHESIAERLRETDVLVELPYF